MGGCSILGCQSRSERQICGVTFHSFPSNPEIRKKWIDATNRQNWTPRQSSKVCSIHFNPDVYVYMDKLTFLKSFAIPTKFLKIRKFGDFILEEPSTSLSSENIFKLKTFEVSQNVPPDVPKFESPPHVTTIRAQNHQFVVYAGPSRSLGSKKNMIKKVFEENQDVFSNAANLKSTLPNAVYLKSKLPNAANLKSTPCTCTVLKKKLARQKIIAESRLKKLRAVRLSRRRLVQRVSKLENIVAELKYKMLIKIDQS